MLRNDLVFSSIEIRKYDSIYSWVSGLWALQDFELHFQVCQLGLTLEMT
uniref:Uncharacterized protein n=1 Tax=Nelumbo nucifera TaxID=4432 RepID=A0A822ZPS5_NELNU|nr:TPA_asm: hypothetical protein HUJ06_017921 [Nelumbo nucifera]